MSKTSQILLGLSVTALLLLGIAIYLNTSLWFLWHLLPATGNVRVAVDQTDPNLKRLAPEIELLVPAELRPALPAVSRLAISKEGNSTTVAFVPNLADSPALTRQLAAAGWQVERVGLALRARQGSDQSNPQLSTSLKRLARTLILERLPLRPAALATLAGDKLPLLNEPMSLIAISRDETVRLVTLADFSASDGQAALAAPPPAGLTIAVPGHMLAALPADVRTAWNEQLQRQLGFVATSPEIIEYLSQFAFVTIKQTAAALTISVTSAPDAFIDTINQWVELEDRRGRPQRQAFSLPDGTLGYEQVPGDTEPVFQALNNNCRAPITGKTKLWLCQSESGTTVSTVEADARAAQVNPDQWLLQIGQNSLRDLTSTLDCRNPVDHLSRLWCNVNRISLTGQDDRARIDVSFHTGATN